MSIYIHCLLTWELSGVSGNVFAYTIEPYTVLAQWRLKNILTVFGWPTIVINIEYDYSDPQTSSEWVVQTETPTTLLWELFTWHKGHIRLCNQFLSPTPRPRTFFGGSTGREGGCKQKHFRLYMSSAQVHGIPWIMCTRQQLHAYREYVLPATDPPVWTALWCIANAQLPRCACRS